MVVNLLRTKHYHLGPVCRSCVDYFTMTMDAMCQHTQLCKPVVASIDDDDDQEEEFEDNDNSGKYDDKFIFDDD